MSQPKQAADSSETNAKQLSEGLMAEIAERFRVLGSVSRIRIVNHLMSGPRSMAEVAAATGLTQSNLSRHVTELVRAGCISRRREGRTVHLAITDPTLYDLCQLVCGALAEREESRRIQLDLP